MFLSGFFHSLQSEWETNPVTVDFVRLPLPTPETCHQEEKKEHEESFVQ